MPGTNEFRAFMTKSKTSLSANDTEELYNEISKRERTENRFPLEVFNEKVKPYISVLNQKYDIPSSFIGLSMLCSYSTAIGTSYCVSTDGDRKTYLPVWACLVGISSSGKSVCIDEIFSWLNEKQDQYNDQFETETESLTPTEIQTTDMPTVVFRDSHIPTLIRWVLPDNPKGVLKHADELIEWINGMNQLSKKEGTDEQFWLSSWDGRSYSTIRSGKQKTSIPRVFVNITGGIQYAKIHKMFENDRDATGFIFRVLFAVPDEDKIADIDPRFKMPEELRAIHKETLKRLYSSLPVKEHKEKPRMCQLSDKSIDLFIAWSDKHRERINGIEDVLEKDIAAGVLGKMKNYALRFAAILHLSDKALDDNSFFHEHETVDEITMVRALKLAEYFFNAALDVYNRAQTIMYAPIEVLLTASMIKMNMGAGRIAELRYSSEIERDPDKAKALSRCKQRVARDIKKWTRQYPKVFGIR